MELLEKIDRETEVINWVNANLHKISTHSRKYLPYSPYELDEFIQTAYEAALVAASNIEYEFERSFWFHFKKACLNMTYNKGLKSVLCQHKEFREYGDDDNPPTFIAIGKTEQSQSYEYPASQVSGVISYALSKMTAKEREVWKHLLQGRSVNMTARILNKSKTAVIKLKLAGERRVESLLSTTRR